MNDPLNNTPPADQWDAADVDATFDELEHDWDDSDGWDEPVPAVRETPKPKVNAKVSAPVNPVLGPLPELQLQHQQAFMSLRLQLVAPGNYVLSGETTRNGQISPLSGFLTRDQLVLIRLTLDPRRTTYGTVGSAEPFIERLITTPDTESTHLTLARAAALKLLQRWNPAPRDGHDWLL